LWRWTRPPAYIFRICVDRRDLQRHSLQPGSPQRLTYHELTLPMITKVGFEQAGCSTVAPKQRAQHHLAVRRCKSALSLSLGLQSPPTTSSMDASIAHTDSYGDLTAVGSTSSMGSASSVSGLEVQHAQELDAHADAGKAIEIPYTRWARSEACVRPVWPVGAWSWGAASLPPKTRAISEPLAPCPAQRTGKSRVGLIPFVGWSVRPACVRASRGVAWRWSISPLVCVHGLRPAATTENAPPCETIPPRASIPCPLLPTCACTISQGRARTARRRRAPGQGLRPAARVARCRPRLLCRQPARCPRAAAAAAHGSCATAPCTLNRSHGLLACMRMRPAFACGMMRERAAGGRGRNRPNAPDHYHSYSHCCSMDCARTFPNHALSSRPHSHAWAQQQQLHAAVYASYLTGASRRYRLSHVALTQPFALLSIVHATRARVCSNFETQTFGGGFTQRTTILFDPHAHCCDTTATPKPLWRTNPNRFQEALTHRARGRVRMLLGRELAPRTVCCICHVVLTCNASQWRPSPQHLKLQSTPPLFCFRNLLTTQSPAANRVLCARATCLLVSRCWLHAVAADRTHAPRPVPWLHTRFPAPPKTFLLCVMTFANFCQFLYCSLPSHKLVGGLVWHSQIDRDACDVLSQFQLLLFLRGVDRWGGGAPLRSSAPHQPWPASRLLCGYTCVAVFPWWWDWGDEALCA